VLQGLKLAVSTRPFAYFQIPLLAFLFYYGVTNWAPITPEPRLFGPMVGSLAQFTLPLALASGFVVGASPTASGLGYVASQFPLRSVILRVLQVCVQCAWITVFVLLFALAYIILRRDLPLYDLVGPEQVLYPAVVAVAGGSLGMLMGEVFSAIRPFSRLASVLLSAFALAIGVFFFVVLEGASFLDGRFSLAVVSRVLEPFQTIDVSLLRLHFATFLMLGCFFAACGVAVAVRRVPTFVLAAGLVATVASYLTLTYVDDMRGHKTAAVRPDSEISCTATTDFEVCAWFEEEAGAAQLAEAMTASQSLLPADYRPERVVPVGPQLSPDGSSVAVADMPSSEREASIYVAEFAFQLAGCDGEQIARRPELRAFIDEVSISIAGDGRAVDVSPLSEC
jgi:hypothetical protein